MDLIIIKSQCFSSILFEKLPTFCCRRRKRIYRLIKELRPSYEIHSITTIKNTFDGKYKDTKSILKNCLLAKSHLSVTFDGWTETMNEKSFFGVTVHYLENISLKFHC